MDSIDYYNQNAAFYYDETINLDMNEVMEPFIKLLPENAEVLDLGCGSGRDTVLLEEAGFSVTPLDGSGEMCKLAEIYTDKEVLHLNYDEMDFFEVFHGIWANEALLHIPHKKMPKMLEKLMESLKNEGILYFSVREGERHGWDKMREFYDYTNESLKELLKNVNKGKVLNVWKTQARKQDENQNKWFHVLIKKEEE